MGPEETSAPVNPIATGKFGIKETKDLLITADTAVDQIKVALADGKLSTVEILTMLVAMAGPIRDALDGIASVVGELKDADQQEVSELAGMLFALAAKVAGMKK